MHDLSLYDKSAAISLSGRQLLDFSREGQSVLKPLVSSRPKRDAIQAPQGPSVTRGGKDTRFARTLQALSAVAQTPDRPASLAAATVRDSGPQGPSVTEGGRSARRSRGRHPPAGNLVWIQKYETWFDIIIIIQPHLLENIL